MSLVEDFYTQLGIEKIVVSQQRPRMQQLPKEERLIKGEKEPKKKFSGRR
jgi:hypothetical protein